MIFKCSKSLKITKKLKNYHFFTNLADSRGFPLFQPPIGGKTAKRCETPSFYLFKPAGISCEEASWYLARTDAQPCNIVIVFDLFFFCFFISALHIRHDSRHWIVSLFFRLFSCLLFWTLQVVFCPDTRSRAFASLLEYGMLCFSFGFLFSECFLRLGPTFCLLGVDLFFLVSDRGFEIANSAWNIEKNWVNCDVN